MKKFTTLLAFATLTTMGMLTACSESDSPDPTRAELCANGASQDCLLGTWTFDGVKSIQNNTYADGFDYSANPGSIEFSDKLTYTDYITNKKVTEKTNSFTLNWPASSPNAADADCNPVYGTWSVEGNVLTLKATSNNMCFSPKSITVTPTFEENGLRMEMKLGKPWFNANLISSSLGIKEESQAFYTEVFSIINK